MPQAAKRATVFLDFDGTISQADVVDAILERYAGPEWLRVEEEWRAGRLGSRECLSRQMALVRTDLAGMDALIDAIGIDEGLVALLRVCAAAGAPVHIVSDGFDYCIERLLRRVPAGAQALVQAVPICASHLEPAADFEWRTAFPFPEGPCVHGCATCKPALMRQRTPEGRATVFVGDGLSDRYAAEIADVVFAKDRLAEYCVEQNISHARFENLSDVAINLNERLQGGLLLGRGTHAPVSA